MLRAQIRKFFEGESAFEFVADKGKRFAGRQCDFCAFDGKLVIWPLENTASSAWAFLGALRDGVVPIVIPGRWPATRVNGIRRMYEGFGFFDGEKILGGKYVNEGQGAFLAVMTSGSTGEPQAILTSEQRLVNGIRFIHEAQGLFAVGSTGIILPLSYSYAMINQLLWAVLFEKRAHLGRYILGPFDALKSFAGSLIEMVCMVAAQMPAVRRVEEASELRLDAVKKVNFAGAPFPMGDLAWMKKLFPNAEFFNNYGCTEAMPRLTARAVTDEEDEIARVGRPIGDIEIKIGGDEEIGPIMFRGSSTALGRLSLEGRLEPFSDWIFSGDWGEIRDNELYLAGRRDQVVKIHGERFSLLEIEQALMSSGFSYAVAWLDTASDSIVAAVSGDEMADPKAIKKACKNRLAKHAWPREIYFVKNWPLNANGKTDRARIRQWHSQGTTGRRIV